MIHNRCPWLDKCEQVKRRERSSYKTDSMTPEIDGGGTSSCSPSTHLLPLPIQQEKIRAVRHQGYNSLTHLTPQTRAELNWWLWTSTMAAVFRSPLVIERDASNQGWGASGQGVNTGGPLDKTGEGEPHQLFGAVGSLPIALRAFTLDTHPRSIL